MLNSYTKKIWLLIKNKYFYKKYFIIVSDINKERSSSVPIFIASNRKVFVHNGKTVRMYKIFTGFTHYRFGVLMLTRKYRPAKFRKSKKNK
jgi:hypothetical protein